MEEYISRIRKLGADDFVNGDTFNSVVQQLQHNIDLLYRSQASSVQNWNLSDIIFGNLFDYDDVGQKRFVNGGRLDSVEKTLAFSSTVGDISFEETTILSNDEWLRWEIPAGIRDNIRLVRNVVIPEALRHQQILIGFKFVAFSGGTVLPNERYEIYVNGVYAGTGETDTLYINSQYSAKTIYGVYNLTGEESNLEIVLVRTTTNSNTPEEYYVRMSNCFAGLHTLGNSQFALNFPPPQSTFSGAAADINSFYDFENNSVRPIPAFLINTSTVEGSGGLTVNITQQPSVFQHEWWVGPASTGNALGTTDQNVMSIANFNQIAAFDSSVITVHLVNSDSLYEEIIFDKGIYEVYMEDMPANLNFDTFTVTNNSSVTFNFIPQNDTHMTLDNINVNDNSTLIFRPNSTGGNSEKLEMIVKTINLDENSYLDMNIGTLSMLINEQESIVLKDGSKFNLFINRNNADGLEGFALATGTIYLDKYSYMDINTDRPLNQFHIGKGSTSYEDAITVSNHSHFVVDGFANISTSSTNKKIVGKLHSSIEIFSPVQSTGATAFTDVNLELFSSFGSPLPGDTLNEELIESFVYEIES
jgi:hypothetical protein